MDKRDRASLAFIVGVSGEIPVTSFSLLLDDVGLWYVGQVFVAGAILVALGRSRKK